MKILPDSLSKAEVYKLLNGCVVPRPIAWVSTRNPIGMVNMAPFSCFTFMSSNPPIIGFNCGARSKDPDTGFVTRKDTSVNIHETGEFVVSIVDESFLNRLHASADFHPPLHSEADLLGISHVPSDTIQTPRPADVPINLECVLHRVVRFGKNDEEFIAGEVRAFHVRDELMVSGRIDSGVLRPLARLAGPAYGTIGEVIRVNPHNG